MKAQKNVDALESLHLKFLEQAKESKTVDLLSLNQYRLNFHKDIKGCRL